MDNSKRITSRKWNRKCFVPGCLSNNHDTPLKAFIKLPPGTAIRKHWAEVVGRTGKDVYFNPVSSIYCCGDHFNLEEDAENWVKYRLMGGSIKLKPGVLPHVSKNKHGDPLLLEETSENDASEEREHRLQSGKLITSNSHSSNEYEIGTQTINNDEFSIDIKYEPISNNVKTEPKEIYFERTNAEEALNEKLYPDDTKLKCKKSIGHKNIQCNIKTRKHVRSRSTQTNEVVMTCSRATSPIRFKRQRKKSNIHIIKY